MEQKIFFSYSRGDSKFALKLATELKNAGIKLWIDQLDLPAGKPWDIEIEKSLENSASLLVILSEKSVTSNNVLDEVSHALDNNKQIYPVVINNCKIPFRLKRLQHIDFTMDYDTGLHHLLQALDVSAPSDVAALQRLSDIENLEHPEKQNVKQHVGGNIPTGKQQGNFFQFLNKKSKLVMLISVAIIAFIGMYATVPVFEPRNLYEDQNFTTYSKFISAAFFALSIVLCYFFNSKKNVWAWWLLAFIMLVAGIIVNIKYNKLEGIMVINTGEYGYGKLVRGDNYFPEVQKIRESYKQSNNVYPADIDLVAGLGGNHLKVWPKTQILSNSNSIVFLYSCMFLCFTLFAIFSMQAVSFLFQKQKSQVY